MMKQLANHALRAKNLKSLLVDMGIDIENSELTYNDEFAVLNLQGHSKTKQLISDIQSLLQTDSSKPKCRFLALSDLIAAEISTGICSDQIALDTHKKSCLAIFNILQIAGLDYTLDQEHEQIEIQLPNPVYAQLFGCLNYKHMHAVENKIKFNLKQFLKDNPEELFFIDGKSPFLFLKAKSFEDKKVFYAQKQITKDEVEVTPYFFIPNASCPPQYHFVLDTSGSMKSSLETLKKSVLAFAETIFQFQPEATIKITAFNSHITLLGTYDSKKLSKLQFDVGLLIAKNHTCLYYVTLEQLSEITKSNLHNNVLLFTDGLNKSQDEAVRLEQLKMEIESLEHGPLLITARNKFFIMSYGSNQPQILHDLTKLFGSPIINTHSADFLTALSEQDRLQEWAAVRELFTCRLEVVDSTSSEAEKDEYICSYDLSGQFTALEPRKCKNNETLHLIILDGNGKVILDDKKVLAKPLTETVGNITALSNFSMFSFDSNMSTKDDKTTTTEYVV